MADTALKQKIKNVLKSGYFRDPEDAVFVTDGYDECVHVVVVSEKFAGRRLREKTDLILSELVDQLTPDEWGKVSLSVGRTPEELAALSP